MRQAALVALVATVVIRTPARADTATANRLEAEAQQLAASGKLAEAAARFREAYAADPRPELMCNVGVAYHKASDWPRAHRYLEQCLAMGAALDAAFVTRARAVLEVIVKKLEAGAFTPIDLVVSPPTAAVAIENSPFDEPLVGARRVYVPFGTYRVVVHAEGHTDHVATLDASRRDATKLAVALQVAPKLEAPRPQQPPPPDPSPPRPPPMPKPRTASRVPAYVATAGTLVLGAVGVVVYLKARDEVEAAEAAIERPDFEAHRDSAKRYQRLSWVAGGLAGVTAVASGYLWYRATRSSTRVEATATADGATVWLAGRF